MIKLHSVPPVTEQPLDITSLNRADIIKRDWSACHVKGDRSKPLMINDTPKRLWRR